VAMTSAVRSSRRTSCIRSRDSADSSRHGSIVACPRRRVVLASITTVRDVGIYSLTGAISTPALVFFQAVSQRLAPLYAAAGASIVDRVSLQRSVTHQITIVIVFGLACAALGPSVVGVIIDRRFAGVGELVPWLVLGYVFRGLYCVPLSGVALAVGRTKFSGRSVSARH
jgi:O-antigen/teichoic acid export membrane protein